MSLLAKKVAGTFVPDEFSQLPGTLAWATENCRTGRLSEAVREFCQDQAELLDPALVLVEGLESELLRCRISCRCCDHESAETFPVDVRFTLDPRTGKVCRVD